MRLRWIKKITGRSWDMILMPDTVIDSVNLLGVKQPELLVFTDWKVRLVGYGYVEITIVGGDESESPLLKVYNENDNINYQEDQEEFHP